MGKRFEVACYKNKVLNWRNGVEKDLDEVLQSVTVYENVSKGVLAKAEDLQKVFGTQDEEAICLKILAEGELQVSDKERKVEHDALFKDIATILSEKCINPNTNRPYTISMVERALRDMHISVDLKKTAKQQALEVLPELKSHIPIERARMRLRLQVPISNEAELAQYLHQHSVVVEQQEIAAGQVSVVCLIEPGSFRQVNTFIQTAAAGSGRVDVISLAAALAMDAHERNEDASAAPRHPPEPTPDAATPPSTTTSSTPSGYIPGRRTQPAPRPSTAQGGAQGEVVYARGPIAALPEEHASRKERFKELDELQLGWEVELLQRGDGIVDAVFYSPDGARAGVYANARRAALHARKEARAAALGL